MDFSYIPMIQSGGNYSMTQDPSNLKESILTYDTILISVGINYRYYNSNIARTIFIDPSEK